MALWLPRPYILVHNRNRRVIIVNWYIRPITWLRHYVKVEFPFNNTLFTKIKLYAHDDFYRIKHSNADVRY